MQFVAVLEPKSRCKFGCYGTGLRGHIAAVKEGAVSEEAVCPCCKVTILSRDPEEALKKLADLTGHRISTIEKIVSPQEFIEEVKERHTR